MSRNTSITLSPHFDSFITDQIKSGRYNSVSDVVRAGLRILESTETKLKTLRNMLEEGEKSGFADYSYNELIRTLDNESI